jgi:hypothetical protein
MQINFAPGQTISLTNLDKIFWPEEGYTKGDLLDYKAMPKRLDEVGDLWEGLLGPGIDLLDMIGRLELA